MGKTFVNRKKNYSTGVVHLEDVNIIVNIYKILAKSHYKLLRIQ